MPSLQEAFKQKQEALERKGLAISAPSAPPVEQWKSPLQVLRQGEFDLTVGNIFKAVLEDLNLTFNAPIQRRHKKFSWSDADNERLEKVLNETCKVEHTDACRKLYRLLSKRTELLAANLESSRTAAIATVSFPGRLRVGGQRGFRERLLPAFHPVYGVPYIPSSSIKGALLAWSRDYLPDDEKQSVREMLGFLEGERSSLGKVQILDAFPTTPSLSMDVSTPQWSWQGDRVEYGPSPHVMLSLKNVTLKIGLACTSLGTLADVEIVLTWLKNALIIKGLGSRISAGYGRAIASQDLTYTEKANEIPMIKQPFLLWSQGIYGAQQTEHELRSTALRGMLRYWFRAVGLGLYSPTECKQLEGELFGTIEPTAQQLRNKESPPQGSFHTAISSIRSDHKKIVLSRSQSQPKEIMLYHNQATAVLNAKTAEHLNLLSHLFKLSLHTSGIGRGSRRPLHINDQRFRGCHWEASDQSEILIGDTDCWEQFLKSLLSAFRSIQSSSQSSATDNPGVGKPRYQDVLSKNTTILLVPCPKLIHPKAATWKRESTGQNFLGEALHRLYTSQDSNGNFLYKGEKKRRVDGREIVEGNSRVGGKLGIPSYVSIQSNFPLKTPPYQTVIVFDSTYHEDRQAFCADLQHNDGAKKVIWPS